MTLNIKSPETLSDIRPRLVVVGLGGAGGNAVNNMIKAELEGVEFIAANTDAQALNASQADKKIQLGQHLTRGLGAGAKPEVGASAARESQDEIMAHISNANMLFIAAGMGGGTGTGAAPEIAKAAKEQGVLTVGVVTKPFQFEGKRRMVIAESGIEELQKYVDTLIIIPNQNLFRIASERTTFAEAFELADTVLYSGVRGVTDLMVMPGLINLDFADIRTVMGEMGKAMMGTGEATGDNRAIKAAESAIQNPLLDEMSMRGAKGVLINVTGGMDMGLFEVDEAANRIAQEVDGDANIIFGSSLDSSMDGAVRVSVVATGIDAEYVTHYQPQSNNLYTESVEITESIIQKIPEVDSSVASDQSYASYTQETTNDSLQDQVAENHSMDTEETHIHDITEMNTDMSHGIEEEYQENHLNEDTNDSDSQDIIQDNTIEEEPISDHSQQEDNSYIPLQDSFIPPPPNGDVGIHENITENANIMNMSALENGGQAPQKHKEKSGIQQIWNRVLNNTKDQHASHEDVKKADITPIHKSTPKLRDVSAHEEKIQDSQTDFIDTADTHNAQKSQLEIPAFLRRQAN